MHLTGVLLDTTSTPTKHHTDRNTSMYSDKQLHAKFSKEYPLGIYVHIDVCKTQLKPTDLEGKLKHNFASCTSPASRGHRTHFVHKDDWLTFNEILCDLTLYNTVITQSL
jgi:hypothetical protein